MSGMLEAPYPADVTDAPASPLLVPLPDAPAPAEAGTAPLSEPVDAVSYGRWEMSDSDQASSRPVVVSVVSGYAREVVKSLSNSS